MITKINGYNSNNTKNLRNVSFGAGFTDLFTDFDMTYFPIAHDELALMSPDKDSWFVEYCKKFKTFLNNTRDGLKFHVTSGRTLGEYETISESIKKQGFELPLPDTYIAKNGSDEYLKIATDEDFYKKGIFPFRYDKTNQQKEKAIKDLTGWDGAKIKSRLKEILAEHDFRIVEGDSENSVKDYGIKSLFTAGKLSYEDNKIFQGTDKPEWVVGLRNDGNCKIFITYPPDMRTTPERLDVFDKITQKTGKFLSDIGASVHTYSKNEKSCGGRYCTVIEPLVDENLKRSVEKKHNQGLTKLYDTKEAVKRAIKSNDLVIAAGDSSNDFNMLNPFQYIDVPKSDCSDELLAVFNSQKSSPKDIIAKLESNNPLHKDIIKQLEDLPFVGIVVKNHKKGSPLESLSDAFGEGSRFHKIITVEQGHLEDGVREAIKLYAEQNPEYAEKLSPNLKKEILGIVDNSVAKNNSATKLSNAKKINTKYLGYVLLMVGVVAGIYALVKKLSKKPVASSKILPQTPQNISANIFQKLSENYANNNVAQITKK